jgi:hypothetical protein
MAVRCAILDDYQNVALKVRRLVQGQGRRRIQGHSMSISAARTRSSPRFKGFQIVVAMRERTGFPKAGHRGAA